MSGDGEPQGGAWAPMDPPSAMPAPPEWQVPPAPPDPASPRAGGYSAWGGWGPARATAGGPRTGPLPLHPMTLGDVLDGAFKLLKANARSLGGALIVIVLPLELVFAFANRHVLGGNSFVTIFNNPGSRDSFSSHQGSAPAFVTVLGVALRYVVYPFLAGALAGPVVSASYFGREIRAGDALRTVGRRWWPLLGAVVLVHLAEAVGVLACVVGALVPMALFVVTAPVLTIEEVGPVAAMRRSWRLMSPRLFPVIGITILSAIIASFLAAAVAVVPDLGSYAIGLRWGWPLLALGGTAGIIVSAVFVALVANLLYVDARIRREGLDVQIMAMQLDGGQLDGGKLDGGKLDGGKLDGGAAERGGQ